MKTSPRKAWTAFAKIGYTRTIAGWIVLDQPETDADPAGRLIAFIPYSAPDTDDTEAQNKAYSAMEVAGDPDVEVFGPFVMDLRNVPHIPHYLHGLFVYELDPDRPTSLNHDGNDCDGQAFYPLDEAYAQRARQAVYGIPKPSYDESVPLDMNGVPVRVGDLVSTDADEIGRVRDIAGTYDSGVTFDLLMDNQSMGLPEAGDGRAWQCSQLAVFLRADGSRPIVPAKAEDTAEQVAQAEEPEPTESPMEAEPPAQTCDRGGRVLVPGDIVVDSANHIVMRVVHTYGTDIIGDFLWQSGDTDDEERGSGSWSTKSDQVIYLSHSAA